MGFVESILDIVKEWLSPINYSTMFGTVVQVMSFRDGSDAAAEGVALLTDAEILERLIELTGPIAMVMMVLYFLINLFSNAMQEREPDMNIFVRTGIYLIIGDLLLINTPEILSAFMGLSNGMLNQMNEAMGTIAGDVMAFDMVEGLTSFLAAIALFIVSFIGKLLSIIGSVIVFVVCVSAKIELMLRLAYAPIGFASMAGEDRHGSMRYLKKLFASAFYCGAIVVAMFIACTISTGMLVTLPDADKTNILSVAMRYVMASLYTMAMPLAAAGVINTAKSTINEAFGV